VSYILLEAPYARAQIEAIQNTAGSMSGIISVDLDEFIDNDIEGLMDIFEERLVDEGVLGDISYDVVGNGMGNVIHIRVTGVVELL